MQTETKMRIFFSLLILSLMGIINPAYARDLVEIGSTNLPEGEVKIYVDRDGIRRVGKFVWFWSEMLGPDSSGRFGSHYRSYFSADCGNYRHRMREMIVLKSEGETVNISENFGDSGIIISAAPGSVMESAIKYACRNF